MRVRVVLIAAKHLAFAKMRLRPVLPDSERRELARAMFRDVLAAAISSRRAERVAVVTSDSELISIARGAGAVIVDEEQPRGLNAAVRLATDALVESGATELCTILSDCPLVKASDIDDVFAALPPPPGAVLVPSRDFTGTNVIARSPAGVIPTVFGKMSLVRHLEQCRQSGVRCEIVRQPGPALDLDELADLREFVRVGGSTNTLEQLARLGIASG